MKRVRNLTIMAVLVGLVGVLLVTATGAFGQSGGLPSGPPGVLLLHTGDDGNWIRYYADPSVPLDVDDYDEEQIINPNSKCAVTIDGPLLSISPAVSNHTVGLVSNGLGERDKNNCSTAQGLIDNGESGESLTVDLGDYFPGSVSVMTAEVDVEGKYNADLSVALDDGAPFPITLSNRSDNGPDSGINDNNIVTIVGPFRKVEFKPTLGGSVAVEGGGDGMVVNPVPGLREDLGVNETLFELVDVGIPVITVDPPTQVIEAGDAYEELGATAWDEVDGDLSASIVIDSSAVDTSAPGTYSVTYDVSDSSGNSADQVTRTVNVEDTTAPVITLEPPITLNLVVGDLFDVNDPGVVVTDVGDPDVTVTVVSTVPVGEDGRVTQSGPYSVTYTATDFSQNSAQVIRDVNVYDGELDCGVPVEATNETGLTNIIERLFTNNPGVADACDTLKPYNFKATSSLVTFDPRLDITANYRADIVFESLDPTDPPVLQYDRDIRDGTYDPLDMQACNLRDAVGVEDGLFPELAVGQVPDSTSLTGFNQVALFPTLDGVTDTDGVDATWCLVASRSVTLGDGTELHFFVNFGDDEPGWSFR